MASRDRDIGRKYIGGAEKKRKRKQHEEYEEKLKGSMLKFVRTDKGECKKILTSFNKVENFPEKELVIDETQMEVKYVEAEEKLEQELQTNDVIKIIQTQDVQNVQVPELQTNDVAKIIQMQDVQNLQAQEVKVTTAEEINHCTVYDIDDPGAWPEIKTENDRLCILKNRPKQITKLNFPKTNNRSFSAKNYKRKRSNGETQIRRWLRVYSISRNAVFCFSCELFSNEDLLLCKQGFKDWMHLNRSIKRHERSQKHLQTMYTWFTLEAKMISGTTIDAEHQKCITQEAKRWTQVMERIVAAILYLAEHNLAFRGSTDTIYTPQNGNFLGLIELIAKFDPIMQDHLQRILNSKGKTGRHYLSHIIQDELIVSLGDETRKKIIDLVKNAKYYSVLLDCTPDVSHQEQLSLILRFVHTANKNVEIREHFINFLVVKNTTRQNLIEILKKNLDDLGLKLEDCRGQGYDNGANMKGERQGEYRHAY